MHNAQNQIRIVNHAFQCEVIYYLDPADATKFNNRMIKHNLSVRVADPTAYVKSLVTNIAKIPANGGWDYHSPWRAILTADLKAPIKDFMEKLKLMVPRDYEFHEVGFSVSKTVRAGKSKFGNIEIKYRPKGVALVPNQNPDRMIVINIHLSTTATTSLRTESIIQGAKKFLEKAKGFFDYAELDKDYKKNGFALSDHPLTVANLARYEAAKIAAAQAAALAQAQQALAFAQQQAGTQNNNNPGNTI